MWTPEGHTFAEDIAAMKREVLRGMIDGTIPLSVEDFGELHDYVDADCLGGWCNDSEYDKLCDSRGKMTSTALDYLESLYECMSEWIEERGHMLDLLANVRGLCVKASDLIEYAKGCASDRDERPVCITETEKALRLLVGP